MRSPADMEIIQIDITNHCSRRCSNCTRFCGHIKEPYFMNFETFKKAVDSLNGYKGVVGIMGGEPTLHPEFERFMDYYQQHVKEYRPRTFVDFATSSFQEYVARMMYQRGRHRGIWTSLGPGYYKHFERIQEIFPYQVINDHKQINMHQGILIPRKELGIPDDEWIRKRDKCWIQNLWSASITPKGAFFCEIAGALDLLFDGPGGWPVEAGWWKRKPEDFKDQLHWCELCSLALDVPSVAADEETDLVSENMYRKLEKMGSWKAQSGHCRFFHADEYRKHKAHQYAKTWFLPDGKETERVSSTVCSLFPQKLDLCCIKEKSSAANLSMDDLLQMKFTDFILIYPCDGLLPQNFTEQLKRAVFNPGFLYKFGAGIYLFNRRANVLKNVAVLDLEKLEQYWPENRISCLDAHKIGKLTFGQKVKQILAVILHRGVFMIPESIFSIKKFRKREL